MPANPPVPGPFTFTAAITVAPCARIAPQDFCIPTMGGGTLCAPRWPKFIDPLMWLLEMIRGFGIFLLPLIPLLRVLNALAAIKVFIETLPANLAQLIAFNPQPLAESISKVIQALAAVVLLVLPPLAFFAMLRGFILALLLFLAAFRAQIVKLLSLYDQVNQAIAKATSLGNAAMLINAQCAQENLNTKLQALIISLGPIATIVGIVNVILCLAFGSSVQLSMPTVTAIDAALIPIDAAIAAITIVLNFIPTIDGLAFQC